MSSGAMERVLDQSKQPHNLQQTPNRKRSLPEASDESNFLQHAYTSPPNHVLGRSLVYGPSPTTPNNAFASPDAHQHAFQSPATALATSLSASSIAHDGSPIATPPHGRPDLKRRKTAPAISNSSSSSPAVPSPASRRLAHSPEKRAIGKDGAEVWPADVEEAFFAALRIVPKLGRRKVLVNSKPCGRNELIADYIFRKTKKLRSRKQVSSHIQVLKNIRRDDLEFMNLVAEPTDGDEIFTPEAIEAFGGSLQICGTTMSPGTSSIGMSHSMSDIGPMPPHLGPSYGMYRSLSMSLAQSQGAPSPMPSPAISDSSLPTSNSNSSFAMSTSSNLTSTPMSSGLSSAFKEMQFLFPTQAEIPPSAVCPIFPYQLCMWTDRLKADSNEPSPFVYAKIDKKVDLQAKPKNTVYLEEMAGLTPIAPQLVDMHAHLPCQFLHVKLDITMPQTEITGSPKVHTQLLLSSTQDTPLSAITTIYSGGQSMTFPTELAPALVLAPSSSNGTSQEMNSTTSSPASPDSPQTPNSTSGSPPQIGPRHKFGYSASLVPDFWNGFLNVDNGVHPQTHGMVMIQEFVYKRDVPTTTMPVSPGSEYGDVLLVIVYDFFIQPPSTLNGLAPPMQPSSDVSFLSINPRHVAAPPLSKRAPNMMSLSAPMPRRSSNLSRSSSLLSTELSMDFDQQTMDFIKQMSPAVYEEETIVIPQPSLVVPEIQLQATSPVPASSPRMTRSNRKPDLSLRIPTPGLPAKGETPPITPWPQMVHTPNCPPPVVQPASPTLRNRLNPIWAAQARDGNEWNLDSPALMGAFPSNELAPQIYSASLPVGNADHNASAAMHFMTANAIAAGTPTYPFFNLNDNKLTHDIPFAMPVPQQHLPMQNMDFSGFTSGGDYFPPQY